MLTVGPSRTWAPLLVASSARTARDLGHQLGVPRRPDGRADREADRLGPGGEVAAGTGRAVGHLEVTDLQPGDPGDPPAVAACGQGGPLVDVELVEQLLDPLLLGGVERRAHRGTTAHASHRPRRPATTSKRTGRLGRWEAWAVVPR